MYLIFDTETSALPNKQLPLDHVEQCRVLQVAYLLLDESFAEVGSYSSLIDIPENLVIHPGAFKAHGITKEKCKKYGVNIEVALATFQEFLRQSVYHIGHNVPFDIERLNDECALAEMPGFAYNPICTMRLMTPVCKIPSSFYNKYKWPKLAEAYKFVFKSDFEKAHDALADVRATAKVFKWLKEQKMVPSEKIVVN